MGGQGTTCSAGFDHDDDAETDCKPWTRCVPGEYATTPGTAANDRVCAPCAAGTFSAKINATECSPWSACWPGDVETEPGTATADRSCKGDEWLREFDGDATATVDTQGNVFVVWQHRTVTETTTDYDKQYLVKLTNQGEEVWSRAFDGSVNVLVDARGDVYAVRKQLVAIDDTTNEYRSELIKLDAEGEDAWSRKFDGVLSVFLDARGDVYAQWRYGFVPGDGSTGRLELIKLNPQGEELWSREITGEDWVIREDGTFLVTSKDPADPKFDLLRRLDAEGGLLWSRRFESAESPSGNWTNIERVLTDQEGNVFVTGSTMGILPGEAWTAKTKASEKPAFSGFVSKLDAGGNALWYHQFGKFGDHWYYEASVTALEVDSHGNLLVAAESDLDSSDDRSFFKLDADGEKVWERTLGGEGEWSSTSLPYFGYDDGDGVYVVESIFHSYEYPYEEEPNTLSKYDDEGELLWSVALEESSELSPNYFRPKLQRDGRGNFIIAQQSRAVEKTVLTSVDGTGVTRWTKEALELGAANGPNRLLRHGAGNVIVAGGTFSGRSNPPDRGFVKRWAL
jgi:hypothetical protein